MSKIQLKCKHCDKSFERSQKEYNRNVEKKQRICCSRSCAAYLRNASMTKEDWHRMYENQKKTFDIKSQCGNRKSEYSPFKAFLNKGRASIIRHKHDTNIDLVYLKEIWDKQNGKCAYTGIKMALPATTDRVHKLKSLKKASIDRIDSSKGYVKGNIEFVCMAINLGKRDRSKQEMKDFIEEIKGAEV